MTVIGEFMQPRSFICSVIAFLIVLFAWGGPSAMAQSENIILKDVELNQADIRTALRDIFRLAKVSYSIDPMVQGNVTVQLKNVTLEIVLTNVLRQVSSTYRVESGVFMIHKVAEIEHLSYEPSTSDSLVMDTRETHANPLLTVDSQFLYVLSDKTLYKVQKSDLKVVKTRSVDQYDVQDVVKKVFSAAKLSYTISPRVHGVVNVDLEKATFESVLNEVLRQADATYRIEAGVYEIFPRVPARSISISGPDPEVHTLITPKDDPSAIAMISDNKYLYVVRGRVLYKLQKEDLKVVKRGSLW